MSGDLRVGSRLPSIRKLAALFGVSVPTMHAATQALVALGFVRISRGNGTFVAQPKDGAAVLNHAWLQARPAELAAMRALIDERAATIAARLVATARPNRVPSTLSLIHLLAQDRASSRFGYAERFVDTDTAFHRAVAASIRGFEITAGLRERIDWRLRPQLLAVADVHAGDDRLHQSHIDLAAAVLDGQPGMAAGLARRIARREAASLRDVLG